MCSTYIYLSKVTAHQYRRNTNENSYPGTLEVYTLI